MYQWYHEHVYPWLHDHISLTWHGIFLTILVVLGIYAVSLGVVIWVLIQLPVNYFEGNPTHPHMVEESHPLVRWAGLIFKNLLGVVLILAGVFLSLPGVPGPGFLVILIGIMFVNFPGKRWLERKLVTRPPIQRAVNRLRARFGKPPLALNSSDAERERET